MNSAPPLSVPPDHSDSVDRHQNLLYLFIRFSTPISSQPHNLVVSFEFWMLAQLGRELSLILYFTSGFSEIHSPRLRPL